MVEVLAALVAGAGVIASAGVLWRVWGDVITRAGGRGAGATAVVATLLLVGVAAAAVGCAGAASETSLGQITSEAFHRSWAWATLLVGSMATALVFARGWVGDRARGRRRCPRCWYDMSGTPGTVCPECGKDAKTERRLGRARRFGWVMAASVLPMAAGCGHYVAWLVMQKDWLQEVPTAGLILASPWHDWTDPVGSELSKRLSRVRRDGMPGWERWLARRVSRPVAANSDKPQRVLFHARTLLVVHGADESTTAALLRLTKDPSAQVVAQAAQMVRDTPWTPEVEPTLLGLSQHPSDYVKQSVVKALAGIKAAHPGGAAPELVLNAAAASDGMGGRAQACRALGGYDASPDSRETLLAAAEVLIDSGRLMETAGVRGAAAGALSRQYPDDAEVRELVVRALRNPFMGPYAGELVDDILRADARALEAGGANAARRRTLYSDDVRAAMIDAATAAPADSPEWAGARRRLREGAYFTPAEREKMPAAWSAGGER